MRKWDIARYTLSQLMNALKDDETEGSDPHAGNMPIESIEDIEAHWIATMSGRENE